MSKVQSEAIRDKIKVITKSVYPRMVREAVLTRVLESEFTPGSIRSVYNGANGRTHGVPIGFVQPVRVGSALYYVFSPDNKTTPRREEYVNESLLINSLDELNLIYNPDLLKAVKDKLVEVLKGGPLEENEVLYHLEQAEINIINEEFDHHELKILLDVTLAYYENEFDVYSEGIETLYALKENKKDIETTQFVSHKDGFQENQYFEKTVNLTFEYVNAIRTIEREVMEAKDLKFTDYWIELSKKATELAAFLYKHR